jgi:hypothetical protein
MVFAASHDRRVTAEMRARRMRGQPIFEGAGQEPRVEAVHHSLFASISPNSSSSEESGRTTEPKPTVAMSRMLCARETSNRGAGDTVPCASTVTSRPSGKSTPCSSTTTPPRTRPLAITGNLVESRGTVTDSSNSIMHRIRGRVPRLSRSGTGRARRRLPCISHTVPKVGLEPTPSCEDRILSPARLPFRHFGSYCLIQHLEVPNDCQPRWAARLRRRLSRFRYRLSSIIPQTMRTSATGIAMPGSLNTRVTLGDKRSSKASLVS